MSKADSHLPEEHYDDRVYLPQDGEDKTAGLAFVDYRELANQVCLDLLPQSVRDWREQHRVAWGVYRDATRSWIDYCRRNPPRIVLEELAACRDLPEEEQQGWRYSERAHAAVRDVAMRAKAVALDTLPQSVKGDLALLSPSDLQAAQDAIAAASGIEGHLGPDGANSFFGSRCGEDVDRLVAKSLRTLALRRDALGHQASAALKALKGHIARKNRENRTGKGEPDLRPDIDNMEEAVLEAAANKGGRRTIRPPLLKPRMNRGGDWIEGKTPDGRDILVAMPVTDAKGRSPQRPGSEFEVNPEIGADFLDGQTEDADMRPVVRAFGSPADRAMAAERDAEIRAVEEHFRGLGDEAALACLDYLLERQGRRTRDDAAAFYGVPASQVRSAEGRVLRELRLRLRRFAEQPRDDAAAAS